MLKVLRAGCLAFVVFSTFAFTAGDTHVARASSSSKSHVATATPLPPFPVSPQSSAVAYVALRCVRSGPGVAYDILGGARRGESFVVTGKNGDGFWWRIKYRGGVGWVYAPLLDPRNTDRVVIVHNPPDLGYDPNKAYRYCKDFSSRAEFNAYAAVHGKKKGWDRDNDGCYCENLECP